MFGPGDDASVLPKTRKRALKNAVNDRLDDVFVDAIAASANAGEEKDDRAAGDHTELKCGECHEGLLCLT